MRFAAALLAHALAAFVVLASFVSLIRSIDWWGVRVLDYPRLQFLVAALVLAAAVWLLRLQQPAYLSLVLTLLTLAAAVVQAACIAPYTPVWPNQTKAAADTEGTSLRLLEINVLMENREATRVLAQIRAANPDIAVLTEPDAWWATQLQPLHAAYPHRVEVPLGNTYGMIVLSRLPLESPEVKYLVEPDIPSVHTAVQLGGQRVLLRFVHPKPPAPSEARTTTDRDAELMIVGREARAFDGPAIVAGDLNDVAWSSTSNQFQRISGLLDPRRGRGLYATFNAKSRLMRWPLDHVFHTEHFLLEHLEVLGPNGSDHFPFLTVLRLSPEAPARQDRPDPDAADQEDATEQINKARAENNKAP